MPRFFFNIREGDLVLVDPEGDDLPDIESAREEAYENARELLIVQLQNKQKIDGRTIEITDDQHRVLDEVALRDVLNRSGG